MLLQWHYFTLFNGRVIFLCIHIYIYICTHTHIHLLYTFLRQWTFRSFRLLLCLGYCKQYYNEHWAPDIWPGVGLQGHTVTLFLTFKGTFILFKLFSIVAVWIYIPTNSVEGFPSLHIGGCFFKKQRISLGELIWWWYRGYPLLQNGNNDTHLIELLHAHAQLHPTLCDPMDCSLPGVSQAKILEWVAISSSEGSSPPRAWTCISWVFCTVRQILYPWATWEANRLGERMQWDHGRYSANSSYDQSRDSLEYIRQFPHLPSKHLMRALGEILSPSPHTRLNTNWIGYVWESPAKQEIENQASCKVPLKAELEHA